MGTKDILVTGGLGRSGRWIIEDLIDRDHNVISVDQVQPNWNAANSYYDIDFRQADLSDGADVLELFHETNPDQVVHWAAYPSPRHSSGGEVFSNNVLSTYYTVTAAGQVGADVVLASSEAVYGYAFAEEQAAPNELPIPINHPLLPPDPYGLSKQTAENIGKQATRNYGINIVALRPAWLQYPGEYPCLDIQEAPKYGKPHFWAYCDIRDLVSAIGATVEESTEGFEAYHVMAGNNYMGEPTAELVRREFNDPPNQIHLEGDEVAYSLEKTREQLGWEPTHTWQSAANEEPINPLNDV